MINLYGKTFSAFGAAAAQYPSAIFCSHADKKAVGSLSFSIRFIGQSLFHQLKPL